MEQTDFSKLQQEVSESLTKAQRKRRIMQCIQIPTYIISFGWVLLVPIVGIFFGRLEEASEMLQNSWPVLLAIFGCFMVAICVMGWAYQYFNKKEEFVMEHLIKTLFPSAKYHKIPKGVNRNMLKNSRFFSMNRNASLQAQTFRSLEMNVEGQRLIVADIGVANEENTESFGAYLVMLRIIWRMISGGRADSAVGQFRGMFTWVDLEKEIPGSVIVLPDHIEEKLGYLAKNIQSLKNSKTEKLVIMEDPTFERYYAVYSSDEVLARYVLTPAMMMRLTKLRERFGRDMMVSFSHNRFYCAVSTPDGFLALRSKAIRDGKFVEEIYEEISASVELYKELRLDKIVKH